MAKVSWGILSTAKIGLQKVIPAMQKGQYSTTDAIASRDIGRAETAARKLRIYKAYGSYAELLADREIQAVYIPLPNNQHVEWCIKALEAGKHVLCEKPIAMNAQEAEQLRAQAARHPRLKVMEAFMYRHHPQWGRIRRMIADGEIGELRSVHAVFTYHNMNADDIRNRPELGGGGLMDIGCYCISVSRLLFADEPQRVCGALEYDRNFKTDRLASGVLAFAKGTATFTCSTQTASHSRVAVFGSSGSIEIESPFTPRADEPCAIILNSAGKKNEIIIDACDQYTLQGDSFSQAILNNSAVATPLSDAIANMKVIDAIVESHQKGTWVEVG